MSSTAESGGVPHLFDSGAPRRQEASDVPARIADGIVQGGADGAVGCFEIRASVNECGGDIDVVAARGVVQRRLGHSGTGGCGIGIGAGIDQQVHDVGPLEK